MLRVASALAALAGLFWLAAGEPATAQLGGCATRYCGTTTVELGCAAYQGPGDIQKFLVWGSPIRAYSQGTCGLPAAYVCDSTGGTDNGCADMYTSTTTGQIVPRVIGSHSLNCGVDNTGNCTVKIIYNIPLSATCPIRGEGGTPGSCDAVQTTVADRYGLYNGAISGCSSIHMPCMFSNAAGAGYILNSSLTLSQPFTLWAVGFTLTSTSTNTLISIGNANIHQSTGSAGNVLTTCDSGTATASSQYLNLGTNLQVNYAADFALTCVSGVGLIWQNGLNRSQSSGGSTSASGAPVFGASGGSLTNLWEFGIVAPGIQPTTNVYAQHFNACTFYGYMCGYSGPGDNIAFKAYWGVQAYSYATMGNRLINACSAGNAACQVLDSVGPTSYLPGQAGKLLVPTIGGATGLACFIGIQSGTYNTITGAVSIVTSVPNENTPSGMLPTNTFALGPDMTGTGNFAALIGGWTATTGTDTTNGVTTGIVNFTAPTGLGTLTITGGTVSSCTIHTFYDLSGQNFCTGGTVPCDMVQATTANRAILTANCIDAYYACVTFSNALSTSYTSPGTTGTAAPFGAVWTVARTGLFTMQQTVIGCGCAYGFSGTANTAFAYDGASATVSGAAADSALHSFAAGDNGTTLTLYVDGASAGSGSVTFGAQFQPFYLGSFNGSAQFFQGQFMQGGLTNTNITAGQAATLNQQQHTFIVGF